jgi:hypothetical protein
LPVEPEVGRRIEDLGLWIEVIGEAEGDESGEV